jgi:hypothetical protein
MRSELAWWRPAIQTVHMSATRHETSSLLSKTVKGGGKWSRPSTQTLILTPHYRRLQTATRETAPTFRRLACSLFSGYISLPGRLFTCTVSSCLRCDHSAPVCLLVSNKVRTIITLMMEAVRTSKTSSLLQRDYTVLYLRRLYLHSHRRENLKSHTVLDSFSRVTSRNTGKLRMKRQLLFSALNKTERVLTLQQNAWTYVRRFSCWYGQMSNSSPWY